MFGADFAKALQKGLKIEKDKVPSSVPAKIGGKDGYFHATQDGAVIVLNGITPSNILGLFTERLKTCIGIFMWGSKGMVLIHDTGMLSLEGMGKIISAAGDIKSCVIAYNPDFERNPYPGYQEKLNRIMPLLKKFNMDKKYSTIEALEGGAFAPIEVSKVAGHILPPELGIQPIHMEVRHWINIINNFFHKRDQPIEPDLQFDGRKMLEMPRLISLDTVNSVLAYHIENSDAKVVTKMQKIHALFWRELSVDAKVTYPDKTVRLSEFKAIGMQNLDDLDVWLQEQDKKRTEQKVSAAVFAATATAAAPPPTASIG